MILFKGKSRESGRDRFSFTKGGFDVKFGGKEEGLTTVLKLSNLNPLIYYENEN